MKNTVVSLAVILGVALVVTPLAGEAQQAAMVRRIGFLSAQSGPLPQHQALFEGLRDFGWLENHNIAVEYRWAKERFERLPELAVELVQLNVELIVTSSTPAALAAKGASSTIPIVMVSPADPVTAGLVPELAYPGGNVTGLTLEVTAMTVGKHVELLKEAAPKIKHAAVIWNPMYGPNAARWTAAREAAQRLGIRLMSVEVRAPAHIDSAFARKLVGADALVVFGDPVIFSLRRSIADLAIRYRLPCVSPYREGADAGGLISYGADFAHAWRRAAGYVDKILRGAKAADLPVEQPTKLEFVINLRTARILGLTVPPSLMLRADHVIE